jgi:hypothetical protein
MKVTGSVKLTDFAKSITDEVRELMVFHELLHQLSEGHDRVLVFAEDGVDERSDDRERLAESKRERSKHGSKRSLHDGALRVGGALKHQERKLCEELKNI